MLNKMSGCKELFRHRKFLLFFLVMLTVEIGYIVWFNFTRLPYALDQDSAKGMVHIAEMAKTGRVFIPDWYYVSTAEIDTAGLLAIPLYVITGNIWVSFALSNCIFAFVLMGVLLWLTGEMRLKTETKVFILCLVFLPWQYGMVEYFNMLFINLGQYSLKALIPLMGIALLNSWGTEAADTPRRSSRAYHAGRAIAAFVFLALVFVCALSSGVFIVATGLLSLCIVYALHTLASEKKRKDRMSGWMLLAASFACAIAGICISRINDFVPQGANATFNTIDSIGTMLSEGFQRIVYLLNGLPTEEGVSVLSLEGVGYLLRFAIACALVIALLAAAISRAKKLFAVNRAAGEAGLAGQEANPITGVRENITDYLLMIFLVNAVIHMLSTFNGPRYCLMEIIPMMILLGALLEKWSVILRTKALCNAVKILSVGLMGVLLVTAVGNVQEQMDMANYRQVRDLTAFFHEYGADNVIFLDESRLEEICRLVDVESEIRYVNYYISSETFVSVDWYTYVGERSYYEGETSLAVLSRYPERTPYDIFPDADEDDFRLVGEAASCDIYEVNLDALHLEE